MLSINPILPACALAQVVFRGGARRGVKLSAATEADHRLRMNKTDLSPDPGLAGWDDPLASLRRTLDQDELQIYCQPILSLRANAERYPIAEVLVRLREEEESRCCPRAISCPCSSTTA